VGFWVGFLCVPCGLDWGSFFYFYSFLVCFFFFFFFFFFRFPALRFLLYTAGVLKGA
jgi:hypothetical protein